MRLNFNLFKMALLAVSFVTLLGILFAFLYLNKTSTAHTADTKSAYKIGERLQKQQFTLTATPIQAIYKKLN